jgi:hypothetical protein
MILLFGNTNTTNTKTSKSNKTNAVKNNNPVENAGILAMSLSDAKSTLSMGEYDTYVSSNPSVINYAMYSDVDSSSDGEGSGFLDSFSSAVAMLGDCGFSAGGFDCGGASFSGASSSSFSSVG